MENMKMSDVFKGNVVVDEIVGNRKQGSPRFKLSDSGVFRSGLTKGGLKYAAHAINNHDRLVEENAELRKHLANLVDESIALAQFKNDTLRKNIRSTDLDDPEWHDYQTIGEAGAYLELLNK